MLQADPKKLSVQESVSDYSTEHASKQLVIGAANKELPNLVRNPVLNQDSLFAQGLVPYHSITLKNANPVDQKSKEHSSSYLSQNFLT